MIFLFQSNIASVSLIVARLENVKLNKIDSVIDVKLDLEGLCHLGSYFCTHS